VCVDLYACVYVYIHVHVHVRTCVFSLPAPCRSGSLAAVRLPCRFHKVNFNFKVAHFEAQVYNKQGERGVWDGEREKKVRELYCEYAH